MTIAALDPDDDRSVSMLVAGPAAPRSDVDSLENALSCRRHVTLVDPHRRWVSAISAEAEALSDATGTRHFSAPGSCGRHVLMHSI
jgi:hypothetical protein